MVVVGVLLDSSTARSRPSSSSSSAAASPSLTSRRDDGTTCSACCNLHGHLPHGRELRVGLADRPSSRPLEPPLARFNPSSWSCLSLPLPLVAGGPAAFSPVTTSAGLPAFLSDASGHKTLLLANPITRLLAALPITPTLLIDKGTDIRQRKILYGFRLLRLRFEFA
uniref:Uncharacterized protein n=1 Tax=Oryza glumipatula TaxID=40148 RepID=A0A0D9ZJ86_9ORYZ